MLTPHQPPAPRIKRIRFYVDRCSKCDGMTNHDVKTRACLVCECARLRFTLKIKEGSR